MKNQLQIHNDNDARPSRPLSFCSNIWLAWALMFLCGMVSLPMQAQTVMLNITNGTHNYWAGMNTINNLPTNSISVTETNGGATTNIVLTLTGTGATVTGTLVPSVLTSNGAAALGISVNHPTSGYYPLTVTASGDAAVSTNFNLFVVPQWATTNVGTSGNWSSTTNWSGGASPLSTDGVYFERYTPGPWTNIVDSSRTIASLIYLGNGDEGASASLAVNTTIPSGNQLSVLGTNGFYIGEKNNTSIRPVYTFQGGGSLLVSNTAADFVINGSTPNATRYLRSDFSGLNKLSVYANRVAIADIKDNQNGPDGCTLVDFVMAQTNVIFATNTDNYNSAVFNTAISYMREDQSANNGQNANAEIRLGQNNAFYADSIGIGIGDAPGSGTGAFNNGVGYRMIFKAPDSIGSTNSVVFRNSDGVSRMSLLAIGVDQGLATAFVGNRGIMDLRGGVTDMLVDQIWIGQDRTNSANANGKDVIGGLFFDFGTINCNTLIAGNMKYTNNISTSVGDGILGSVIVGTNGTLYVNNNLILGLTPTNVTGFAGQAANVSGQLMITNGGTLRAHQITVGQYSTNNIIIVAPNGSLVVSNTIATAAQSLTTLNMNGGSLTFSVAAGTTNAFVTNLLTTTTATKINIAAAPAGQSTNVLIVYQAANQVPNISIGTLPAGFNNMQIVVDPVGLTVSLVISTNQPKNLAWRGGQNSQWDHSSLNWLDLNSLATTKFTDGDSVTFDDTAAVPTSITIAESVNPGQSGTGILVTNSVNNFTFNNVGAGSIGSCLLVKQGTGNLEIDAATSAGAQVNNGSLTIGGSGMIANATTAVGTSLTNNGTISGGVSCAGAVQSSGSIAGSLSLLTSSSVVNSGTVNGNVSMQSGTALNNSGTLTSIGTTIVPTNSTLINGGTIYGSSLTINTGGTLTDTVLNSAGVSSGSINVGTLTVTGTFYPGGSNIGVTKITDYASDNSTQLGNPNGRVQLAAGSTTILQVNTTLSPANTMILSQNQGFGPSQATKAVNGCTLVITNLGPAFYAGQTFQFFGAYYTGGNIGNAGLNTTNSYPLIQPKVPGPGLVWDLSNLIPGGTIGVISASSVQVILTNSITVNGSNIVTELSWPASFTGNGWVQQQITTLETGLSTNWSNVGPSAYVNDILLTNVISGDSAVFYRFIIP